MTSNDPTRSQPDHTRSDSPARYPRRRPDAAANARNERRIRRAYTHRDLTRRTRARTGKPFSRRELLVVGGGAAVIGAAFLSLPLLRDTGPRPRSVPPTVPTSAAASTALPSTPDMAMASPTGIPPTAAPTLAPAATPSSSPQRDPAQALVETSVADVQGFIARREVTVSGLIEAAEARVAQYDEQYGAMIEMNPDAREIARQLDDELANGRSRGPLHGVPIVLKDIIATGDSMKTTSGSLALAETPVVEDAKIVQRLREAGAVILGKTNMTEWSNIRAVGQLNGWSDRGGYARNPYDPEMATWGSSSGSASAVSMSYAPLSIGAETNGSILCPAAACDVVGMKPTVGLVSRVGAMPVSTTLDSLGPMGRSVTDVATLLNVIAGHDPDDPAYGPMGWLSPAATVGGSPVHDYGEVDYLQSLDPNGLQGARIGVCWGLWGTDPEADAIAEEAMYRMQDAGAELMIGVSMPSLEELRNAPGIGTVINTEFAVGMAAFFERYMPEGPVRSMQQIVDWNNAHADVALAVNGQGGLTEALVHLSLDDPEYQDAASNLVTQARANGMDAVMDEHNLDAILAPTAPVPTTLESNYFPGASTQMSALSGYPSITVPVGWSETGLPVGLHLSGRAFSEQVLLRIAYATEQLIDARVPPVI